MGSGRGVGGRCYSIFLHGSMIRSEDEPKKIEIETATRGQISIAEPVLSALKCGLMFTPFHIDERWTSRLRSSFTTTSQHHESKAAMDGATSELPQVTSLNNHEKVSKGCTKAAVSEKQTSCSGYREEVR